MPLVLESSEGKQQDTGIRAGGKSSSVSVILIPGYSSLIALVGWLYGCGSTDVRPASDMRRLIQCVNSFLRLKNLGRSASDMLGVSFRLLGYRNDGVHTGPRSVSHFLCEVSPPWASRKS